MVMEERTLQLNLISAEDLKKVTSFGQQTCYAVAYIYENDKKASRLDKEGGLNPTWNSEVTLTCDDKLLQRGGSYITINIYSYGSFSNKIVGTVTIPLLDIAKEGKDGKPSFMAFEVRRPSGKVKGILNFSVKVGEKRTVSQADGKQKFSNGYSAFSQDYKNQGASPFDYPQAYPPTSTGLRFDPLSPFPSTTASYGAGIANAGSVYPPPKESSGSVYPPPKASTSSSSSTSEEPVLAYPAPGFAGSYPQQYGQQYGQQYYPSAQANAPYDYQQAYYSKPHRRHGGGGGGGLGMGLLGGALGGLLLGDLIGGGF